MKMSLNNKQYGAVSLFIVVITALLVTVITVSFVGIMIKNQQQASVIDLSQSAYDSAQAGVEDAKRALLHLQSACVTDNPICDAAKASVGPLQQCNDAVKTLDDVKAAAAKSKNGEVNVQVGGNNNDLDQAYTCVKISLQTDDYVGVLTKDDSKIIPLVGVGTFDTVNIEWFSAKDLQGSDMAVNVPSFDKGTPLLDQVSWTSDKSLNRPAILRTQLIEFNNSGFSLSELNDNTVNATNNTLFLYPSTIVVSNGSAKSFSDYDLRLKTKSLTQVHCEASLTHNNYSCSEEIKLPKVITAGDHTAYLNLTAIYKNTHYRISLQSGVAPVQFNSVQPKIDSTGRTNDLFRRVEARVELNDVNFPYPTAAIYTQDDFCKDFLITDNIDDYKTNCNN